MSEADSERDPIEQLADPFVRRLRAGQHPSVSQYVARSPDLKDELLELIPALVELERNSLFDVRAFGAIDGAADKLPEQLGDSTDYEALLPWNWAAAHPESIRTYRAENVASGPSARPADALVAARHGKPVSPTTSHPAIAPPGRPATPAARPGQRTVVVYAYRATMTRTAR